KLLRRLWPSWRKSSFSESKSSAVRLPSIASTRMARLVPHWRQKRCPSADGLAHFGQNISSPPDQAIRRGAAAGAGKNRRGAGDKERRGREAKEREKINQSPVLPLPLSPSLFTSSHNPP